MGKTGVLPETFPACAVDIMPNAQIVLNKNSSQLPAAVIVNQDQQIQVRQGVDIACLKGTVYSNQCHGTGTYCFFFFQDCFNDPVISVFQAR